MPASVLGSQFHSPTSSGMGFNNTVGLKSFTSAKYLLGEEEDDKMKEPKDEDRIPTPDVKSYLQLTDPDDKFPTLVRHDDNSGLVG